MYLYAIICKIIDYFVEKLISRIFTNTQETSMVFSSLIFVLLFLPLNILLHTLAKNIRTKNAVMLTFSLAFYAWAGLKYLILFVMIVLIAYVCALAVDSEKTKEKKKLPLFIGVGALLLILGIFKYTGFFLENVKLFLDFPSVIPQIALPLGISFYTFQLMSYVIDVYRGDVAAQKNYFVVLLYAGLFHQCVAGPIVRYKDIEDDIFDRSVSITNMGNGISRFAAGLFKKAILANSCSEISEKLLSEGVEGLQNATTLGLVLGCAFYMLQIYLDFSAYSDMAIGMGLMTGFRYKENFNYPYAATSITDFWRRWHISLSSFFRDYVYIPLGGNRCSQGRQIFNMFVVWALTGFWHGASWNYVLWGLYYFVFLFLEKYPLKDVITKIPSVIRRIFVLVIVFFGWIIFKFESFDMIKAAFVGIFNSPSGLYNSAVVIVLKNNLWFLILAALATTPIVPALKNQVDKLQSRSPIISRCNAVISAVIPAVLLLLSVSALAGDSYNPFLYFIF